MRPSSYAKALFAVAGEGTLSEEKLLEHFLGTLRTNGHVHMLPRVLRAYERILAKHTKKETIEVTTATELSQTEVATLLRKEPFANVLTTLHKRVERKVDSSVVGGAIVRTSGTRIDASYKRKLLDLYQSLTTQ